ncbi:multi-sensor hybrid histidine kinase [Microseira wollei NIES-4236]|uniref:histidine kinase n=2 Tax=Microseira wollei TaxID=467598 RepID=A0AAV3XRA8_9CYAN|nr:multi-sensor hybrid histidine kinase [Microseira wollei NIES-4236]
MTQQERTILIVERGLQDRKRYRNCLLAEPEYCYRILEEKSAEGALALCRGQLPDGILVDFGLPEFDGLEFIEKLKKQTGNKCPPVVMISEIEDTTVAVKAIKSGAEDYLIKEKTTPDELRSAVRSAIENAQLRQKLQDSEERFRTSVENMLDCFGIYSAIRDASGKIVDFRIEYLNAAALESNRMTPENIGQRLCELLPAHRESGLFAEYCRVVETGQPLIKETLIYADVFGGQKLTRAYDIRASKWNDGFVASWRDVTERKQTEEALLNAYAELEERALELTETNQDLQVALEELHCFQEELHLQNTELEMARASSEVERQRYRDLFNFAPDGYLVTDKLGIIQEANCTAAALVSANQEFLIGKRLFTFVSPQVRSGFRSQFNQLVDLKIRTKSLQSRQTWELILQPIKGESFPAEVSVASADNLEGEATGWRWLIRDITKRKQAEEELLASRELIEQIADTTPGILYLYDLVEQRNVYVNRQVTELLGYSSEQVQRMGENLLPTPIHPEDFARTPDHLKRLSAAPEGAILEIEYRMQRANGEWRWFCSREVVFSRNADGSLRQVLGTALDITERKQAEIELCRANERYELAAAAVNCLIYDWDLQSNRVERTRGLTELLGYAPEEAEPTTQWWMDRIHPEESHKKNSEKFFAEIATIDRHCIEYRVQHKNGHYVWVEDRKFVVRDDAGRPIRIVGSTTDISARKQAQEALRQSETRLKQLVELNLLGVMFWHTNGTVLDANDAFLNMVGYKREDLQAGQLNWRAITPPEQLDWSERSLQKMRRKTSDTLEKEYIRKDGSRVPVLLGGVMFEGSQSRGVSFVVDLSERKQMEDELRRRERQFSTLVENLPDVIFRLDPNLRHLYICPSVELVSGMPPQQFIGKTGRELGLEEEMCDLFETKCNEAIATKQVTPMEFSHRGRHFYARIIPEYAPDGSLESLMGITEDITDRKQSEALFRGVFESDMIGILFWNIEGQITDANDAFIRMTGYSREELQGGKIYYRDITPPEYSETDKEKLKLLHTVGKYEPFEKEYICKDGRRIPILLGCAFLPGYRDRGVAFVLDISDRKQLEQEREQLLAREKAAREEAEHANHTKDEFLAIVSHELRSPLNSILGWAKLLRTRTFDPAVVNRALETIERNAQTQCQLIEDLLDISRMIRGNLRLNVAPVNLNYVVETAINAVRPTAEHKQIHLGCRLDCTFCQVSGDLNRLQQIVGNLLNNAIKFTPSGGRVEVELQIADCRLQIENENNISNLQSKISNLKCPQSEISNLKSEISYAQITVTDTGKGISHDFLPYVFERFRRADSTTTRSKDGLGLGLAIVRHLVELHGGNVLAESAGEGQGATFTVRIPLISCPVPVSPAGSDSEVSLTGVRILVVDDETDMREFLEFALNESGAIVETAASAREALAIFNQFKPDILISDIGMPEEDGYSLIQKLRLAEAQKGERQIPAIALTAYARKQDGARAIEAGFARHITKPVEPGELVEAIAKVLIANC